MGESEVYRSHPARGGRSRKRYRSPPCQNRSNHRPVNCLDLVPLAGFFALQKSTPESAARLDPIGYEIALELIVESRCRKVVEVPIRFQNRLYGQRKSSLREQVNYLRHLARLYLFRLRKPRPVVPATPLERHKKAA